MQYFFFDIQDFRGAFRDEDGEELANREAARAEALLALGELARDAIRKGREGKISIAVRDAENNEMMVVSAVVEVACRQKSWSEQRISTEPRMLP